MEFNFTYVAEEVEYKELGLNVTLDGLKRPKASCLIGSTLIPTILTMTVLNRNVLGFVYSLKAFRLWMDLDVLSMKRK